MRQAPEAAPSPTDRPRVCTRAREPMGRSVASMVVIGSRLTRWLPALAALALLVPPRAVTAQWTLFEDHGVRLGLSGYARALTAIHDRGYDMPPVPVGRSTRTTGIHGQVVRLKWRLEGDGWRLHVHDRVQVQVTSGEGDRAVLGFGVSAVPGRLVDLETVLVDEPGLRAWHDVDRLAVTLYTGGVDLTVGRQAITWGVSGIFPVADLWAQFSPFELDTEEKPGIDAVRALFYPLDRLEMDAVLAHRGDLDDLSFGVRGTYGLPSADVWAGGGKLWRELMVMGGVSLLFDETKVRAEAVLPWSLDGEERVDPRLTAGFDWIRGTLSLTGEYHYNGIGAADPERYPRVLTDPRLARGETYYIGRHYLGGLVSWSPDVENRLILVLNALCNLRDPSAALTPIVSYDLGQASRLSLGALVSLGETPGFQGASPTLHSEFGAYGTLVFTRLSLYF